MRVLLQLQKLGFNFTLEGDQIKYEYRGSGHPDPSDVLPLLEEVQTHKKEAIQFLEKQEMPFHECYRLISGAIDRISNIYRPGTIDFLKAENPGLWIQINETEYEVDHACLSGEIDKLKRVLKRLEDLWKHAHKG